MTLSEKVHGVRLLLGSLNDPYPTPQGALRPDSGPAPSRYLPCETCRSTGRIRARGGFLVCLVCDGTGEKRRRRDDADFDAYMRMPVEEANELPREPEPARVYRPVEPGAESYAWERAQQAHERCGSYRELRLHLDWLRQAHPRWHALVKAVLVEHEPRELGPRAALELDLGVLALAMRMRSVRVPRWLREPAAVTTGTSVAVLHSRGLQPGEIARMLGLTKKAVRRQLKRVESRHAGAASAA